MVAEIAGVAEVAAVRWVVVEVVQTENKMRPGEAGAELGDLDCRQEPRKWHSLCLMAPVLLLCQQMGLTVQQEKRAPVKGKMRYIAM